MMLLTAPLLMLVQAGMKPEDTERWSPVPPAVEAPEGRPPSDAVVLFDGRSLAGWVGADGGPAKWTVQNGAMRVTPKTGDIASRERFGDVQLHVEWRTPTSDKEGQARSNSGVFLMGLYEVQVLDSYRAKTYVNGQAASLYKQHAPLVNASRPPGSWQSYDIVFRAPRFDGDRLVRPARVTVFHNGVLVQHDAELAGPTVYIGKPEYKPHAAALPITLQDHGDLIEYRNIWARRLR
ncbi:3-keto-disaccharide hydrolase [Sphingomonas lenta]|uniref:3-keto-alpha-glucoside-1,2-lyase/3-keto-2-hydroxy-glucal hydratase domain-containing protein n=1 Tax=Sphingomonas lenta TaxID=1141887 RepID=A0A2A2SEW0_9SPHN|nr:DUF1080 domain-containing protein [Sphingomonas lenta]PAX07745.1 hypothetical protein CKY28_08910 [Sphingomonas lenta]